MAVDIAAKFRVTAAALGCNGRKALCARFRAVNCATTCEIDSLHKWMQGRALPRAPSLYADWAAVLGLARPPAWIAESPLEDFIEDVAEAAGHARPALREAASPPARAAAPVSGFFGLVGGVNAIAGSFACYSPAMSPHFRGRIIRGALTIGIERGAALRARYEETLPSGAILLEGPAMVSGRTLNLDLTERGSGVKMVMILHTPGPPASVLCGLVSCAALLAHDPLPSAGHFLAVRAPPGAALSAGNRYLPPEPGAIATDLAALGLDLPDPACFDRDARAFLAPPDQVPPGIQAGFAAQLDPAHMAAAIR